MARIADLLAAGRTYSFEFFPPRDDATQLTLGRTIAELEPLRPSFVSVTYGAGGSTASAPATSSRGWPGRRRSPRWPTSRARATSAPRSTRSSPTTPPPASRTSSPSAVIHPPMRRIGPATTRYATDLLERRRRVGGDFSVGVAAHPEVHPKSPDRETDRRHLAAKLASADFAITQFFFESGTTCASSRSSAISASTSR